MSMSHQQFRAKISKATTNGFAMLPKTLAPKLSTFNSTH